MVDEIVIQGTGFARKWPVGLGIGGVADSDTGPLIRVGAVDLGTGAEAWHDVRRGESFEVAGQRWEVAEVRYGPGMEQEVVLRRVS